MFDWTGLKDKQYFILRQTPDPLKYCNYSIPIPLGIGLPFMPCDLPNQYTLYESNEQFSYEGDIYLSFEQDVSLIQRVLIPASHRPWTIVGKDYYNHTPYVGLRDFNICLAPNDRPQVRVYYKDKYIGKIVQKTVFNCCCWTQKFQEFHIFNAKQQLIYRVQSKNPQRGHFIILPCWGFDKIQYDIIKIDSIASQIDQLEDNISDVYNLVKGDKVGQITHLFNGWTEYTSKNDKYGLKLPENSTEEEKCLLIYCTLFIDYLLFQNF